MHADQIKNNEQRDITLGSALIASGKYLPEKVLPEIFGEEVVEVQAGTPEAEAAYARGDVVEDMTGIEWESPSSQGEEEVMRDLEMFNQAMAQNGLVTVDEGEGEWL
jgi:hypothetical protein